MTGPDTDTDTDTGTADHRTLTLGDARDDLLAERERLAARFAAPDEETDTTLAQAERRASRVNRRARAVAAACEEYGADATVRLQRLTAGRAARVDDYVDQDTVGGGGGARRNARVAMAVVAAPFYPAPEAGEGVLDFDRRLRAVADQPEALVAWLNSEADEFSAPDPGNWQPFDRLVAAKRDG